jgi:hypothetical protein
MIRADRRELSDDTWIRHHRGRDFGGRGWFTRKMFGFSKKENPLPKVADWATGLPSTSAYGGLCRQSRHRLRLKISL